PSHYFGHPFSRIRKKWPGSAKIGGPETLRGLLLPASLRLPGSHLRLLHRPGEWTQVGSSLDSVDFNLFEESGFVNSVARLPVPTIGNEHFGKNVRSNPRFPFHRHIICDS